MKQLFKSILISIGLYTPLRKWMNTKKQKKELLDWERGGRPSPPPHVIKQQTIKALSEKYGLDVLVETGTYYGDMVDAMKPYFNHIYSIELSEDLYRKALKRFGGEPKVEIIQGNSGVEIGSLIGRIKKPALFWLDGHYSAGETAKGDKITPIYEELEHIFNSQHSGNVIIIDDARCFGVDPGYPSMEDLINFVKLKKPDIKIKVKDDSIRVTP